MKRAQNLFAAQNFCTRACARGKMAGGAYISSTLLLFNFSRKYMYIEFLRSRGEAECIDPIVRHYGYWFLHFFFFTFV